MNVGAVMEGQGVAVSAPVERGETAKRRQILEGAGEVFLRDGFDAASMNEIARVAGVSKGTLYVYFANKELLFEGLIRHVRAIQAEQICVFEPGCHDVRLVLQRFGSDLIEMMCQPSSVAHYRTVLAASAKFPHIGRTFYEAGPGMGANRLSKYLDAQVEAGIIATNDTLLAATQFIELCQSGLFKKLMLSVIDRPDRATIEAHVAGSVALFLRAYAPHG